MATRISYHDVDYADLADGMVVKSAGRVYEIIRIGGVVDGWMRRATVKDTKGVRGQLTFFDGTYQVRGTKPQSQ